ncbi:glucose uptake inhibitor SgrT [Affinibrenneria salicis]|uniref:Glucose uptake inhibitor SgrT n=2 Tax=Affinibrenneria salicis TaxID=2590031 RepID=A0A5J5G7T6_9GAMM|nr:glucose uptake inhibitor SgrT [Affinibrenneria salicis]KAA9003322.1 glucose uptake inhibitor SgrT [Affinibrenneria salicis]
MMATRIERFWLAHLKTCRTPWLKWLSARQRLALLQQTTQSQIAALSEEEYRHWL